MESFDLLWDLSIARSKRESKILRPYSSVFLRNWVTEKWNWDKNSELARVVRSKSNSHAVLPTILILKFKSRGAPCKVLAVISIGIKMKKIINVFKLIWITYFLLYPWSRGFTRIFHPVKVWRIKKNWNLNYLKNITIIFLFKCNKKLLIWYLKQCNWMLSYSKRFYFTTIFNR